MISGCSTEWYVDDDWVLVSLWVIMSRDQKPQIKAFQPQLSVSPERCGEILTKVLSFVSKLAVGWG